MNPLRIAAAVVALIMLAGAGYAGWAIRDAAAAKAAAALSAAASRETVRQAALSRQSEDFLRAQLDMARKADAAAGLGAVRCTVSVRNPDIVQSAGAAPAGANDSTAANDAAAGAASDIGPALEKWAEELSAERERLRALQFFDAKRAVK